MKKTKLQEYEKIYVGCRVHWYKYSSDMVIIDGGRGLVIDIFNIDSLSAVSYTHLTLPTIYSV